MSASRELTQKMICEAFEIKFPYVQMGKVDSLDLFNMNELEILAFYEVNKSRYKRVSDIGANLGLHSIFMAKQDWNVMAYEPDPAHYEHLLANLVQTDGLVTPFKLAISNIDGQLKFRRVFDNLTASHLSGCKETYGSGEWITVDVIHCLRALEGIQFAKLDCEGAELSILLTLDNGMMQNLDIMTEISNEINANLIYGHFSRIEVPMWSQKNDWRQAESSNDLPKDSHDGNLFIGHEPPFK